MRRRALRRLWLRFSVWFIGPYVEPPSQQAVDRAIVDWAAGAREADRASVEEWGGRG